MSASPFLKIPVLSVLPVAIVAGCGGAAQPWVRVSDPLSLPVTTDTELNDVGVSGEALRRIVAAQFQRLQRLCEERSSCDAQHFALNYGSLDACFRMEINNLYTDYDAYDLTDPECVDAVVMRNQCLTDATECSSDGYYTQVSQGYLCHDQFQAEINRACLAYEGLYEGAGY